MAKKGVGKPKKTTPRPNQGAFSTQKLGKKQKNAQKRNLKMFDKISGTVEQQKRNYNLKVIVEGKLPRYFGRPFA